MKAFNQNNNNSFSDFYKTAACTIILLAALLCTGCDRTLTVEDSLFSPGDGIVLACDSQVIWGAYYDEIWEMTFDGHVTNSYKFNKSIHGLTYENTNRYLLLFDNSTYSVCQWYEDGTVTELFDVNRIGAMRDIVAIDGTIGMLDDFANVFYLFNMEGEVIDSFSLPMEFPHGIDYDGSHLWISGDGKYIYKMNMQGRINARYSVRDTNILRIRGLACSGDYLWLKALMKNEEIRILKVHK